METKDKISSSLLIFLLLFGFITTFFSGFYISSLLKPPIISGPEKTPKPSIPNGGFPVNSPLPSTEPDGLGGKIEETTRFLPGKHYFDDTVIAITKDKPEIIVVATATRKEQDSGYLQDTRISYFNGSNWDRKISINNTLESAIVTNGIIRSWNIDIDPSRVLKQTVNGSLVINNSNITFSTGLLTNEIPMRSLPGYTKFLSKGEGSIIINGQQKQAYILYTRIYSLNSKDIQFYDQPLGLLTDWAVVWDSEGNMYHLDSTSVDKPTEIYKTHKIGIFETFDKKVATTFNLSVTRSAETPPNNYIYEFKDPINRKLNLNLENSINKAPNNSFKWYMGLVRGNVYKEDGTQIPAFGIIEYINN